MEESFSQLMMIADGLQTRPWRRSLRQAIPSIEVDFVASAAPFEHGARMDIIPTEQPHRENNPEFTKSEKFVLSQETFRRGRK